MSTPSEYHRAARLAVCVAAAMLGSPRLVEAQTPVAWIALNSGCGGSSIGTGLVGTTVADLTVAVRVHDGAGAGVTMVAVVPSHTPTDSLASWRGGGGIAVSFLLVRREADEADDRLGDTFAIGIGAFEDVSGVSTVTTRPGLVGSAEVPMTHGSHMDDGMKILAVAIPQQHGHVGLVASIATGFRIF